MKSSPQAVAKSKRFTRRNPAHLTIRFVANVGHVEEGRRRRHGRSAVATRDGIISDQSAGYSRWIRRIGSSLAEFNQRLEIPRFGQGQDPEKFDASASFVDVHFDGFFLFLAHLTLVRVEALRQVEDPVAIHAQRSAFRTDDL